MVRPSDKRVELGKNAPDIRADSFKGGHDWPVAWKAYRWGDVAVHVHLRLEPLVPEAHAHSYCAEFQWLRTRGQATPIEEGPLGEQASGELERRRRQKNRCEMLVLVPVGERLEKRELGDVLATPVIWAAAPSVVRLKLLEDCPMEPIEVRAKFGISELARLVIDWEDDTVGLRRPLTPTMDKGEPPCEVIERRPEVVNGVADHKRPTHEWGGVDCFHSEQVLARLRPGLGRDANAILFVGEGLDDLVCKEMAMFFCPLPFLPPSVPGDAHGA